MLKPPYTTPKILALLAVLAVIYVGYMWYLLWQPQYPVPEIARDLTPGEESADFEDRLLKKFLNADEAEMKKELAAQGFHVEADYAAFSKIQFPCMPEWTIEWEAQDGKVASLIGEYDDVTCQ